MTGEAGRLPASALRRLVEEHYDFIWRLLARLNVSPPEVDDAAQQVFMVLVSREGLTLKEGSERAFLYGVALRVAKEFRRKSQSQLKHFAPDPESLVDRSQDAEASAQRSQARRQLDQILETMPDSLKEAFILFEIEDLSVPQIAELLAIPTGTVASRLRRARAQFQRGVLELRGHRAPGEPRASDEGIVGVEQGGAEQGGGAREHRAQRGAAQPGSREPGGRES